MTAVYFPSARYSMPTSMRHTSSAVMSPITKVTTHRVKETDQKYCKRRGAGRGMVSGWRERKERTGMAGNGVRVMVRERREWEGVAEGRRGSAGGSVNRSGARERVRVGVGGLECAAMGHTDSQNAGLTLVHLPVFSFSFDRTSLSGFS